jgi:putative PIN family toxin of toxin-antitoxin system
MVTAVVDTNVLISATLFGGKPQQVLNMADEKRIEMIISPDILAEFTTVLQDKFDFSQDMAELAAFGIKDISTLVMPTQRLSVITERDADNRVLECAIEGNTQYIVTGDTKHLQPLKEYKGIKILSPAQFLAVLDNFDD